MWHDLFAALALVLVIEGVFPFLSPGGMRKALSMITEMDDRQLRMSGFISMIAGVVLLYIIN